MARHAIRSTLVLLIFAASSSAATVYFGLTYEPTPGMATHTTYTLRAISSHPMQGFDFSGDGSNDPVTGKGFFGPMNQVRPFSQPTVYSDNNTLFNIVGADPKQDSQFLVRTADVVVPAGFAEEGPNILQGIWAHAAPVGNQFDIAQLVIPNGPAASVSFRGTIATLEGGQLVDNNVSGSVLAPAEPASTIIAGVAAVACLLFRWRTV